MPLLNMLKKKFGKKSIPQKSLENIKSTAKSFDLVYEPEYCEIGIPFWIKNSNYALIVFTPEMGDPTSKVYKEALDYLNEENKFVSTITRVTLGNNDNVGIVTNKLQDKKVTNSMDVAAEVSKIYFDSGKLEEDEVVAKVLEGHAEHIQAKDSKFVEEYVKDCYGMCKFIDAEGLNPEVIYDGNIGYYTMGSKGNHKLKIWYV